jgi:hypothetical protein
VRVCVNEWVSDAAIVVVWGRSHVGCVARSMTAPGKDEKLFFQLIRAYPEAVNLFESYCKRRDRPMLRRLYAHFTRHVFSPWRVRRP